MWFTTRVFGVQTFVSDLQCDGMLWRIYGKPMLRQNGFHPNQQTAMALRWLPQLLIFRCHHPSLRKTWINLTWERTSGASWRHPRRDVIQKLWRDASKYPCRPCQSSLKARGISFDLILDSNASKNLMGISGTAITRFLYKHQLGDSLAVWCFKSCQFRIIWRIQTQSELGNINSIPSTKLFCA